MTEAKRCPICGTMNEHDVKPDVEMYSCDTCGYFKCIAFGEGGHGIDFDAVKFDWLSACKKVWALRSDV